MPRTRSELDRDSKVAEIVEAAERRLRDGGYDALSVAALSRELGVAQNAIYWYFPSKDHLFVAALERLIRTIAAGKPRGRNVERKVNYFADRLADLSDVRSAMYERARSSEVVADFVHELHDAWRRIVAGALREHVPESELAMAVETLIATIQGALLQDLGPAERRRVIAFALERLTAPPPRGAR
jgi:AcrR family transcriptional regulator